MYYNQFASNVYSQNGEDGILAKLLEELGISSGWCCEFGADDGEKNSNTLHLIEQGWSGVYIERNCERWEQLNTLAAKYSGRLKILHAGVDNMGPSRLDSLLARTAIPRDFEVLSMDTEGTEFSIWKATKDYSAKVVIIEINSSIPADCAQQNALLPTAIFALGKGYEPVCHTGNLILVRQDLCGELSTPCDWSDDWCDRIRRATKLFRRKEAR